MEPLRHIPFNLVRSSLSIHARIPLILTKLSLCVCTLEPFTTLQLRLFLIPITSTEEGFQCNIQGWGKKSGIVHPPVHHCCISSLFDAHLVLSLHSITYFM